MALRKNAGFGVVGVIVIAAVISIAGVIAWRAWDVNNSKVSAPTTSDPYAGWKTYCDETNGVCFKYPGDWTVTSNSQNAVTSLVARNPSDTLFLSYGIPDTRDGVEMDYYAATLEALGSNDNHKVVGGFTPSNQANIMPSYEVVDTDFTKDLEAGQTRTRINTARFSLNKNSIAGHLRVSPPYGNLETAQAKAWFTSEDAKIALLIAKSFSLQ